MGRGDFALASKSMAIIILLLLSSMSVILCEYEELLSEQNIPSEVTIIEDDWNQSGVAVSGLTVEDSGNLIINRPSINWQTPVATTLPITKTGASALPMPELGEIWIIGGKDDPNPQQSNDETFSETIEAYHIDSQSTHTITSLPSQIAYAGTVLIGDEVFVIGDWWPGTTNPGIPSDGGVHIYNITNDSWRSGAAMPAYAKVGHAGVCEYGGYIWVAGGVTNASGNDATNRTLRYDPVNDSWAQFATMNNSKFGFSLIPFEDKLYALGGGIRLTTWGSPSPYDIVEVYDPAIDNWTQLNTTIPKPVSGSRAVIRHNEIVMVGGMQSSQVVAWSPKTDLWRTLTSLPANIGDMAVASINGTIHAFGGDLSFYPYGTWGQTYSEEILFVDNISSVDGYLTSDVLDLRPNAQASAQPRMFSFAATQPIGTLVEMQYRTGIDSIGATSQTWSGPSGNISTWYLAGEHPLNISGRANFFQYRARLYTSALSTWDLPTLQSVTIEAAHSAFIGNIPASVNVMGNPVHLVTEHADENGSSVWLKLQPVTATGGSIGEATILTTDENGAFSMYDPQQVVHGVPTSIRNDTGQAIQVDWSLTISDTSPTNNVILSTGNLAPGQNMSDALTHVHLTSVELDDTVTASIGDVKINSSEINVTNSSVIPSASQLAVTPIIEFADGTTIQEGEIEWRLQAYTVLTNSTGWYNWSEDWTTNSTDLLTIPEEISGICTITLQVRTSLGLTLNWDGLPLEFVVDGDNAILLSSVPINGTYIDISSERNISLTVGDSGGPEQNLSSMKVWIEGHHDGVSQDDGIPQLEEYEEVNFTVEGIHGIWWINSTINETGNPDHGSVHIIFSGLDRAGNTIGLGGQGVSINWETRDARLSEILEVRPLNDYQTGQGQLIEPMNTIGWEIDVTDYNNLSDVQEIRLYLGGDQTIGVRWDGVTEICQSLGGWVNPDYIQCSSFISGEIETVSIEFALNWDFLLSGLEGGKLSLIIVDNDGTNDSWYNSSQWFFSNQVNGSSVSIIDNTGLVKGSIDTGHVAAAEDVIVWTSHLEFLNSGRSLNGTLTLVWSGMVKQDQWQGSTIVQAVNGYIESTITLPSGNGDLDGTLEIWDPSGVQLLLSIDLPTLAIDGNSPILQESQKYVMESRYALDEIIIIANIQETASWTGNLTIDCQVRSFDIMWPVYRSEAPPDSLFADLVLFEFKLDIQDLGDASLLPEEATFACWLSGNDDAGNSLDDGGLPNQATEPWLELPLPSNGPDLTVELYWKDDVSQGRVDLEYLVGMNVVNLDDEIDEIVQVEVWLEYADHSEVIYRNSKDDGLPALNNWAMTFGFRPNSTGVWTITAVVDYNKTVAELNETNNHANLTVTIETQQEGLMGKLVTTTNVLGIIMLIAGIAITSAIIKKRNASSGSKLRVGPPSKRGPPPASASRKPPESVMPNSPTIESEEKYATSIPILDLEAAGDALAAIAPTIEETQAKLSDSDTMRNDNQESEGVDLVSVQNWEGLPGGGNYESRNDGTWYVGESCGTWRQNEDGGFDKIT